MGLMPNHGKEVKGYDKFIRASITEAKKGCEEGGIPIGSVIVYQNEIIGRGHNRRIQKDSVILHAEMDAIENAGRQNASVYSNCFLVTTLSPCSMCAGAILLYGIPHVIIGENRNFVGAENLLHTKGVKVDVLDNDECYELLRHFIVNNPSVWDEDIGR